MRKLLWLLALAPLLAWAGTVPLTWTNPTKRTDGTALTNLASTKVYRASTAAGLSSATAIATVPAPATTYTDIAPGGQTWFYATTAVDANGLESAQTNPVSAIVPVSPPNPPTNLTVGSITAFDIVKTPGKLAMLAVGTVPLGTPCDTSNGTISAGRAYYAVPAASVTFFGSVKPPVIFASCAG